MSKKIAISFFGTGNYLNFLPNWYVSIKENFITNYEKKFIVFTDGDGDWPDDVVKISTEHYGYPETFHKTFETLLRSENEVSDCDWFISIDADMEVVDEINYDEIFDDSKKYIGVHHPCHYLKMPPHDSFPGSFDTNPLSNGCVTSSMDTSVYYQGCVWGGKIPFIFDMMRELDIWTKEDISRNSTPIWHEESYFNKFFITNKEEVKTLGPEFAYPELFSEYCNFPAKIMHLAKNNNELHQ